METQEKTDLRGAAVRIHPKSEVHNKIEKIQSFLHLTTSEELTKEEVCLYLIDLAIPALERRMGKMIQK